MLCAWEEYLRILPPNMRREVDKLGREELQELRLRVNKRPQLILFSGVRYLEQTVTREDLSFCINAASRYSPWAASTLAKGYLTAQGGHRIGICGNALCRDGCVTGFGEPDSLCIRAARDYPGISRKAQGLSGSLLILGAPCWGKTTLLRDLCRSLSRRHTVCVVDERGEVFPEGLDRGESLDVLTGCPKPQGMDMLLRTMSPDYIALDEITAQEDCDALIRAAHCGVQLIATAHASSQEDLFRRSTYRPLAEHRIFQTVLLLKPDKTYTVERMTPCTSNGSVRY